MSGAKRQGELQRLGIQAPDGRVCLRNKHGKLHAAPNLIIDSCKIHVSFRAGRYAPRIFWHQAAGPDVLSFSVNILRLTVSHAE